MTKTYRKKAKQEIKWPTGYTYPCCEKVDDGRFSIGCDHCDEWYHAQCIGINRAAISKIDIFYCESCRKNNDALQIIFKQHYRPVHIKKEEESEDEAQNKETARCRECPSCRRFKIPTNYCNLCDMCTTNQPLFCYQNVCMDFPVVPSQRSKLIGKAFY